MNNQIKIGSKLFSVKKEYVSWLKIYKANHLLNVGDVAICPVSGIEFIKKTKTHSFFNTAYKDDFWNKIDPKKRNSSRKSVANSKGVNGSIYGTNWATQGDDNEMSEYNNKD